jgi:hypothetical protein
MKYEMSQGQYVDFLNTLSRTQQGARVATDISGTSITNIYVMSSTSTVAFRNTIQCLSTIPSSPTPVVFSTGSRNARAANYFSWMDLMAYADWAALRPMTELEFEKAARGPLTPVTGEFAWGTKNITSCTTISGTENGTEYCSTSNANCNYNQATFSGGDVGSGPLRVGIFSTTSTTTREKAGAGYYGNMDLSGSGWEKVVTVGNAVGRAFNGTHGNGVLSTNGNANVADWPGYSSGEVTSAAGSGFRGGSLWDNLMSGVLQTSDRSYAAYENEDRYMNHGGRLARTAPS